MLGLRYGPTFYPQCNYKGMPYNPARSVAVYEEKNGYGRTNNEGRGEELLQTSEEFLCRRRKRLSLSELNRD